MDVHCDDLIDDPTQPQCLRTYLEYNRRPAIDKNLSEADEPRLFADLIQERTGRTYLGYWNALEPAMRKFTIPAGTRVRVVMASRFGDVGITTDLDAARGYSTRVSVSELTNFSATPSPSDADGGPDGKATD